ncbi:MAG: hypothetical protein WCF81_01680 [Roseiarcus sp.]
MTDERVRPANCAACAFWRKHGEHQGLCVRHAPDASAHPEEVAHWPETHSSHWCGEGVAADAAPAGPHCKDCIYWRRGGELNPVDRGYMLRAWWAKAGICARHAPRPGADPGSRSFWRATQGTDLCAEGLPRHGAGDR